MGRSRLEWINIIQGSDVVGDRQLVEWTIGIANDTITIHDYNNKFLAPRKCKIADVHFNTVLHIWF